MSDAATPIRVFLLDDHEVVRQGLRALLESGGDIVVIGESGLAQEAAARIPALRPDVAALDARLPDGSGIEVCRSVRGVDPGIKALILTSYDDDEALFAAIMAGAAGCWWPESAGTAGSPSCSPSRPAGRVALSSWCRPDGRWPGSRDTTRPARVGPVPWSRPAKVPAGTRP